MWLKTIHIALLASLSSPIAGSEPAQLGEQTEETRTIEPSPRVDLEKIDRSRESDVVYFRNGDRLSGSVLNESFEVRTSYARLTIRRKLVAAVTFAVPEGADTVIETVDDARFSGSIVDPTLKLKVSAGETLEIRTENLSRVLMRKRDDERKGIPRRQLVVLRNGDRFTGKVLDTKCRIVTEHGSVPLDLRIAESLVAIEGNDPSLRVEMRNGDVVQGTIDLTALTVMLDIEPQINVPFDRVARVSYRVPPLPIEPETLGTVQVRAATDDFTFSLPGDAIVVEDVPPTSQYYGVLRAGDRIVAVDGENYVNGMLTPRREELLVGTRDVITLKVSRGETTLLVRLLRAR